MTGIFLIGYPTRIVELTESGMDSYLGTYDYYVEKKQAQIQSGKKYMDELSSREKAQMDAPQSALQDSAKDTPEGMSSLSAAEQRKLKKEQEAKDRRIRRQKESLEARHRIAGKRYQLSGSRALPGRKHEGSC